MFYSLSTFSQKVTGYVYYDQKPISDVNIFVKDSFSRTTSDENGKFTLNVKIGDIIIFSHIAMETKEIKIHNYNSIKINLNLKLNNLDEVEITAVNRKLKNSQKVYTAYGIMNLRGVGHSVYSINMEAIKNSATELPQALMGRIPTNHNVTNQGVILRNGRSFALWDIDGVLFDGLPPFIDIKSIESIHVIIGGAGTVRYGTRGSGGVIIINTIDYKRKKNKIYYPKLKYFKPDQVNLPHKRENISKIFNNSKISIDSLRLISHIYQKNNHDALALKINRLLLVKDSNNIKSYRDVAESLLQSNKKNEAWYLYKIFLEKEVNITDKTSFDIIFHDMERLYHPFGMKKIIGKGFESQKKSLEDYKNETRIVFEWTVPNEMISIEIHNPKNESINLQLGSKLNKSLKIEEIFIDETLKGNWRLNLNKKGDLNLNGYLKVTVYKNWISTNSKPPDSKVFSLRNLSFDNYKLFNLKY